jgi:hypothetical protein
MSLIPHLPAPDAVQSCLPNNALIKPTCWQIPVWPAKLFLNFAYLISEAAGCETHMAHGVTNVLTLFALVAETKHVSGKRATVDPELESVIH